MTTTLNLAKGLVLVESNYTPIADFRAVETCCTPVLDSTDVILRAQRAKIAR
jgi:hypothetical protein